MKRIAAALLFTTMAWTPAWAQADFTDLRLELGDVARVTQPSGIQVTGVVTDLTPESISIGSYTFNPEAGLKIDRSGDSIFTGGTLVGIGFGALVGGWLVDCYNTSRANCAVAGMTGYGALGLLLDYLHQGRTTVFKGRRGHRASTVIAPVISRDRKAIVLSRRF